MDKLHIASESLNHAQLEYERDYNEQIFAFSQRESRLQDRMSQLISKKEEIAETNGNRDATDDDLVEVNAGGEIVVAKRSTLTQIQGTKFEAIFSGRWDKKLLRDSHGRIFLDVDPTCFRAIIDHLNEMLISSRDSPPSPPSVDGERKHLLQHQLDLFGIVPKVEIPESAILNDEGQCMVLHDWLKEDGLDGEFILLYQGSRNGLSSQAFHSNCDNKGCTLTIIKTTCGRVIGGYSNTPWTSSQNCYDVADKAFLFALSGSSALSHCKMKLKDVNDPRAIFNHQNFGPGFGGGRDIRVTGSTVKLNPGCSYHPGPLTQGSYTIKEMEVFQVSGLPPVARITASTGMQAHATALKFERETRFSADVNKAIDAKQACLLQAEAEMFRSEESFDEEQTFIEKFALGDAKDVISLNVSGTMMVTTRSTLCAMKDSVLAQQFDDSKWTEQGCDGPLVDEWTPDQVSTWAKSIKGLPEDVGIVLYENEITGRELLAMNIDSLKMMGLKRAGTVALLLKEIEKFDRTSQDVVTLIEHSPYCFGKILDYLRLKQLHLSGLIVNEPKLPEVCDTQKRRFEKVVKYYFPGIAARSILG